MGTTNLLQHSLADAVLAFVEVGDYYFDKQIGRYRDHSNGRLVGRRTVLDLANKNIERQSLELVKTGDRLSNGEISLSQFQREAGDILRRIHIQQVILGRQGIDRIKQEDWLDMGRELRRQYYAGKDPATGRRYGLRWLAQEILDGSVTPAQLKNRLSMYADSGRLSYWQAERRSYAEAGREYAKRRLGSSDHCIDCVELAERPIQPIADVIIPGVGSRCRTRCHCTLEYYTRQQAIETGELEQQDD